MKVVIHFGFPKTMSSTLQFGVFKPLHDKKIVNLRTWRQDDPKENLDYRPSSRLFNYNKILDSYLDFKDDVVNILSDESFTAPIKLRKNNYGDKIADPFSFPDLIKKQILSIYGDKVEFIPLIMIRNQADLIYSQYVEEYNLKKYKDIDLLFDRDGNIDLNGFEIYNFYRYLTVLNSTFGEENVNLLLFEEWKRDFIGCCDKVSKLIGVSSDLVQSLMSNSHVNKKKKSDSGYYTKDGSTIIPFLNSTQKDEIKSFFLDDNLKLQKFLGSKLNLSDFNYI